MSSTRCSFTESDDVADAVAAALTEIDPRYEIQHARQLADARHIVHTQPIDIALIDLTLPDADGRDAAFTLKVTIPRQSRQSRGPS